MKRHQSLLLVVLVIVMALSASVSAKVDGIHAHYDDCIDITEFYNSNDASAIEYWNSIKDQVPTGTKPTIIKNGSVYPLNFRLWHDKHLVVYGSYRSCNNAAKDWKPKTQPGSDPSAPMIDGQGYYYNPSAASYGEYRFHGFAATGDKFTNVDFPVDAYLGKEADKDWIIFPWSSSKIVPSIDQSPYNISANQKNNVATQKWINRAIPFSIHDKTNQVYKYLHVQQSPTTNYPGQGRMWHLHNGGLWYESFPIPKMDPTTKIPVKTSDISVRLKVTNPVSDFKFIDHGARTDNDMIKVSVTVTAELLDAAFYDDPAEKVNHYTRDDIDHWIITLNGESQTVHKWSGNTGTANFTIPLTKAQIKGLQEHRYTLAAKGQACFLDQSKSIEKSASGYVQFVINDEPVPPPPTEPITPPDPEIPPVVFEPSPSVPEFAFDIIALEASDNTDMSMVESRKVFIDGVQVDDNTFFTGGYIFGDGSQGLKQVVINYTSTDGQKAQVTKWVLVYSTKPKAQYQLNGTYKQNRKLTLTNTSPAANDAKVLEYYPINSYQWEYAAISGNQASMKMKGSSNDLLKEFLYKEPGTYSITLRAVNALGRVSDPYTVQFVIAPDVPPAVEICLDNSVLARNETVGTYHYLVSSTDGDVIQSNVVELWYDSDNNGTYDQLISTRDGSTGFPTYTPTKLGKYKFINRISEDFGQDTLPEFIVPADKMTKVQEVEFLVDNYVPMTDLYVDIPVVRPQVDVFILEDANLDSAKNSFIQSNRMNFNNFLRSRNILPQVNNWDMHTYQYSQSAYTSVRTGSSYPASTTYYSSGGYAGTLNRTSVSDNGYNYDYGNYQSVTETKSASLSASQSGHGLTNPTYPVSGGSRSYSDSDGYSGSLPLTSYNYSAWPTPDGSFDFSRSWTWSGTVSRTRSVWVPNWRWVSDYTGYYSGTIYNYVRQPYVDPFRSTSSKYVVYVSDGNVSELSDLQYVMGRADAKLILIGQDNIRNQIGYDSFILNNKPIDQLMEQVLEYIAQSSPAVQKYYVLAGQDTFNMSTANFDEENDPIVKEEFQYVQAPGYFDNPTGMDSFSVPAYSDTTGWISAKANKFNTTGEFHIYRRIQDKPSNDPNFAHYSYYSGTPELIVYSHRKPVANATLNWDFNVSENLYNTTWLDLSYDPDHQFSRSDKGVVERKIMYRRNGAEWVYRIPDKLQSGSYELQYYVKDPEGAWSDPFILNFNLNSVPPMQFEASARTLDGRFSLSSVPASEFLEAYNLWTRFPYNVYLQLGLYSGSSLAVPVKTIYYSSFTGIKGGNDITWNNVPYQLPDTLPDGTYVLKASALGDYGQNAYKNFSVTVNTPINLTGTINHVNSNAEIQADSMNTFTFTTSRYVSGVRLVFKGQTYSSSSGAIKLVSSDGGTKTWEIKLNVPSNTVTDNETGYAAFTASTPSGKSETVNVSYKILVIRAYDFTITSIQDIRWRGYYFDLANPIHGDGERYGYPRRLNTDIKTAQMPVNSLGLVPYTQSSVAAGYRIRGYIRIKGNPDSADLVARYTSQSMAKYSSVSLSYVDSDKYAFEWIIPQNTDSNSYVGFDVVMRKGPSVCGNEKWQDTWAPGNSPHWVLLVRGTVLDDILFNQSN